MFRRAAAGFILSRIRIENTPITEATSPIMAYRIGRARAANRLSGAIVATVTPSTIVATIEPTYDSKMSAPMPATSPTLSPTLSAMVAGLRGSSSGIPASTFPTRSAPTSAAFVKMPPPILANSAIDDAPIAKPLTICPNVSNPTRSGWKINSTAPRPARPRLPTARPITAPPLNATLSAFASPDSRAASVVRTLARVAACMPRKPAMIEQAAPNTYAAAEDGPISQ